MAGFCFYLLVSGFILTCCPDVVLMLGNVTITGFNESLLYVRLDEADKCVEVVHIKNDNTFDVDIEISNGKVSHKYSVASKQQLNLNVSDLIVINVTQHLLINVSVNTVLYKKKSGLFLNNIVRTKKVSDFNVTYLSLPSRPALQGLHVNVTPAQAFAVNERVTIKSTVTSEFNVTFAFNLTYLESSNSSEEVDFTITTTTETSSAITFIPSLLGNYSILVKAMSVCGETLNTTSDFEVMYPIEPSTIDSKFEVTPNRGSLGVFYPRDIVGIALKVINVNCSRIKPIRPNCTVDWGDNVHVTHSYNVDLTPDLNTSYIYNANYSYTRIGSFKVIVNCSNPVSHVNGTAIFRIVSPAKDSSVSVVNHLVPYAVSGSAIGSVLITHKYLQDEYSDLHITAKTNDSNNSIKTSTFSKNSTLVWFNYTERGIYSVNVTFDSYNETRQYQLYLRIGAFVDFNHVKHRKLIRVNEPTIFRLVRYKWDYSLLVSISMSPDMMSMTFANDTDRLDVNVTYVDVGMKKATATISLYGTTEEINYEFETYVPCVSTIDLFEASYRLDEQTPFRPLRAWLSTLPKLSGRAERTSDCNESDQFNMTWRVWRKEGDNSSYKWTEVVITQPKAIVLDFIFIKLSGLYKIELNISVVGKKEKESDTMYLNVERAPLVAKIKKGFFRQHNVRKDLIVDAQSFSYDPPLPPGDASNLSFSWTCYNATIHKDDITRYALPDYNNNYTNYRERLKSLKKCKGVNMLPVGKITLNASVLQAGSVYLFEVKVTKDDRNEVATQAVEIVQENIADVFINCTWNCDRKLSIEDRTVFTAEISCIGCTYRDIFDSQYWWSVYEYDSLNDLYHEIDDSYWGTMIISYQNSSRFDTDNAWWKEATLYKIILDVTVSNYAPTRAIHVIYTNEKPYNGTCSVHPLSGTALETIFSFTCTDWRDESINATRSPFDTNFGLQYAIYQMTSAGFHLVYFGSEIQASTMLSECPASVLSCEVVIYIIDLFKTRVNVTLQVEVKPKYQQQNNSTNEINEDIMKKMNSSRSVRDSLKVAKRAATLTASMSTLNKAIILNSVTTTTTTTTMSSVKIKDDNSDIFIKTATDFVDIVGGIIHKFNARAPEEIQILANSMSVLTNDTKLMTPNSMETASAAMFHLTTKVQNMDAKLPDLNRCLEEIADVIHNIVQSQAVDTDQFFADTRKSAEEMGLTVLETKNYIETETKKMRLQIYKKSLQVEGIINNITSSWDGLLSILPKMEDPAGNYNKSKQSYTMRTQKTTIGDIKNQSEYSPPLGFTFDDVKSESLSPMVVKAVKTKNIFIQGSNSRFINTDIIIGSVDDKDGIKLNLNSPQVLHKTEESNCTFSENLTAVTPKFIEGDASQMFYHQFEYPETHLHICLKIRPVNPLISYTLYMKRDFEPTDLVYDIRKELTSDMFKPCEEICFPPNTFTTSGIIYIGLKPFLNETNVKLSSKIKERSVSYNLQDGYSFGVTTSSCFSWNDTLKDWVTDQCKLMKANGNIVCICQDSKEIISAVSFNFQPNTIHFGSVFSKFDIKAQGIVFGVLIGLYVLFIITCFWAHYMDKKGMFQWGVFPLVDNYCNDNYYYLISVHTGLRKSAGTKSNIHFCLSGEDDETKTRELSDGVKEGFPAGSLCHFVMACDQCLGDLQCIKVWHDNSGKGSEATWYLDRIDIVDIQTLKAYYFICEEWLAPETCLETTIEATSVEDLETLKGLFFSNTKQHLTDDHIWLSVFIRPQKCRFSRVERAACCLAFLSLAMITSAMFYTGLPDANRQQPKVDFEIGPLRIGYQQMYNSFLSAVITAVPMMLMMTMFRKARTKSDPGGCLSKNKVSEYDKTQDKVDQEMSMSKNENDTKAQDTKKKKCNSCLPWMSRLEQQLQALDKILMIKTSSEELKGSWPHPFRYLAWILVASSIGVSGFFVILYSMEWGKDITEDWLSTFFLAFLQSLFVLDPFKVIVLSVVLALLVRKVKPKSLDELDLSLITQVNKEYGLKDKDDRSYLYVDKTEPLSKAALRTATLHRKIYIMIKKMMNEFVIHFLYLLIVSSLCYANRNNNAYRMHKVISDQLITDTKTGFKQINSSKEFFNWTTTILTPWLLPDLNTKVDSNLDRILYTEVKDLYRIGAARLRQLRIEKENCNVLNINLKDCVPGYTSGLEETKNFCLNWMPKPCSVLQNLQVRSSSAWTYKSAQDVWGLPIAGSFSIYGGGGYIVNLNINSKIATDLLNEMKEHLWIDQMTRAVFLEFTVYSPNINHFAFVILLIEFIETGSTIPFVNIYPFPVHNPPGLLGTYVQMCQVIGIVVTLLGVMYVVFIFGKKKWSAFKDIWFLLDTSAVVIAICAVVMFMLRLRYTKSALIKLKENRNNYINFYHIVIWDTAYSWCLAWLVAIGYMRVLKLASYSEKTMKIYTVLSKSVRIFPGFLFFTIIILLGFIGMGYALFGKTSYYFKDLLTTAESLFTGLLGRSSFRDTNVTLSDRWTTILYFCLFVAIVVIFLTNYFIAVLMDLLVNTGNTFLEEESTQIFSVLWDSFLKIFGSKRNPSDRLKYLIKDDVEVEDETKSIEEENMANKLERRIDRLFDEFFSEMENFSRKKEISHSLQEFDDLGSNMSLK